MKRLAVAAIVLWGITVAVLAFFFVRGTTRPSSDNRVEVVLSAGERDLVLGEMRGLLAAVHGLVAALGDGDSSRAAAAVRGAGMAMAVDVNPTLMAKLPAEFKTMGMSVHADFDALGDTIAAGATDREVLRRAGAVTSKCVACHATYRLSAAERAAGRP